MTRQFCAIGEVLWDVFPDGPRFGGAPANVAGHAAALGLRTAMVSCVGDDDYGRRSLSELQQRNINIEHVSVAKQWPTGLVNVRLDESGKPHYTIEQPAAWDHLTWSDGLLELAGRCHAVCYGTLGQREAESREVIRRFISAVPAYGLRVCDVNLRPPFVDEQIIRTSLELANVLKLSDEEVEPVADACGCSGTESEILAELLDNWGLHLIAVTRGSDGATLLNAEQRVDCPGAAADVKDTVGAGDAFAATLITGLLHGKDLELIGRKACEISSYVCSQNGATPPLPESLVKSFV